MMLLVIYFILPVHETLPFAVAEEGDDGVDGVESGIEVYTLIDI